MKNYLTAIFKMKISYLIFLFIITIMAVNRAIVFHEFDNIFSDKILKIYFYINSIVFVIGMILLDVLWIKKILMEKLEYRESL